MSWESQQNFRSMEAAIPMVKKSIADLVKSAPKIPTWVLTSFKDPDVKLVRKTADVEELKTDLDALKYYATFCVETGASLLSLHQQISLDLQICI